MQSFVPLWVVWGLIQSLSQRDQLWLRVSRARGGGPALTYWRWGMVTGECWRWYARGQSRSLAEGGWLAGRWSVGRLMHMLIIFGGALASRRRWAPANSAAPSTTTLSQVLCTWRRAAWIVPSTTFFTRSS